MTNLSLTPRRGCSIYVLFLLVRGVSGDGPEGGAGSGVLRLRLVTVAPEGSETARRALRPVLPGSWLHVLRREMAGPETRTRAENRHGGAPRGAASRSQGTQGRLASAPACSVTAGQPVPRKHRAPVGAPPTPHGVEKVARPGRQCAAGTRCAACLGCLTL